MEFRVEARVEGFEFGVEAWVEDYNDTSMITMNIHQLATQLNNNNDVEEAKSCMLWNTKLQIPVNAFISQYTNYLYFKY